jgi:hypothetical protein
MLAKVGVGRWCAGSSSSYETYTHHRGLESNFRHFGCFLTLKLGKAVCALSFS